MSDSDKTLTVFIATAVFTLVLLGATLGLADRYSRAHGRGLQADAAAHVTVDAPAGPALTQVQ